MTQTIKTTPEERARKRVREFTGLMWHVTTFLIVNGFLWALDLVKGGGLDWAYWVTLSWGIGLVFHIAAYLLGESGPQTRRYQRLLEEEQTRESLSTERR